MRSFYKLGFFIGIAALLLTLASGSGGVVRAQTIQFWEAPQRIPGLVDTTPSQFPFFITDSTGQVHVFHAQWDNGSYSIMYSKWAVGVGWTNPVDVFRPTAGQARLSGAFLDQSGMVYLMFWGGDEEIGAEIYLIKAPLVLAGKSTAWSKPLQIGNDAIAPTTAAMVGDGLGTMHVVYSSDEQGHGLYSVSSTDNGETWTTPYPFFLTNSDDLWPSALKMTLDKENHLHAVWGLANVAGTSERIYHAQLDAATNTWTSPTVLAEAIGYEANTPNIIEYDGELIVIYHNNFPTTRWMLRSDDDGQSWSSPTRLFEQVGSNGAAALAIDSSDTLHMFFGNRIGYPATHGLWHSIWLGDRWSVPEAIVSGPQIVVGENNEEGFDPSYAQAVISRGNLLLVIWRHDPMAGPKNIWYSYRYLDSAQLPSQPIPVPFVSPTPTQEKTQVPSTSQLTAIPAFNAEEPETAGSASNINITLMLGIGPVILMLIAVVYFQRNRR